MRHLTLLVSLLVLPLASALATSTPVEEEKDVRLEHFQRAMRFTAHIEGGTITPNWMPDGESFWYSEGGLKDRVFLVQRPDGEGPRPLFDRERVRAAIEEATGRAPRGEGIPFGSFTFRDEGETVRFKIKRSVYDLRLADYSLTEVPEEEVEREQRARPQTLRAGFTVGAEAIREVPSPDGEVLLRAEENNLSLRHVENDEVTPLTEDGEEDEVTPLTEDGEEDLEWGGGVWSSDGKRIAATRSDSREVPKLPVIDWLQATEEIEFFPYSRSGQAVPLSEVWIIEVESGDRTRVEGTGREDEYVFPIGWREDGSELVLFRLHREFQKLEVLAANPQTGESRVVLTETSETFIGGLELLVTMAGLLTDVGDDERFLWRSDRSGWRHLYLYDSSGKELAQVTSGEFPIEAVQAIDLERGWVYFTAHAEKDPYETHLYRAHLDGSGFQRLTEGPGEHAILFSPSKNTFLDTFSSPLHPPRTEYRRADGELLCVVAEADISGLEESGWSPPEKFIVPAADGTTPLHGLLFKPHDFDPSRKYPILDSIYNGPFVSWVPHTFVDFVGIRAQAYAELGFLVMVVDGRGTTGRSKAFQDVVYRSFGQNEIPDHAAALHALAAERPYIDLDRVGIFGGSWGGYMTVRAMVTHPEVYHVGVAAAPVYDLYDHAAAAIEGYMGTPEHNPEGYEAASSIELADQLRGKLLLIHGTSDVNAPISTTMKMTHALIQAGKQHDLIIVPQADHSMGSGGEYISVAEREYFREHLHPERVARVD